MKQGLTVAHSEHATELIGAAVALDHAAALVEFEDDPEQLEYLTRFAVEQPEFFEHALERARQNRERAVTRAAREEAEAAAGFRILTTRPGWESSEAVWSLHQLQDADGNPVTNETLTGRAGVSAYISPRLGGESDVTYYVDDPETAGLTPKDGHTTPHYAATGATSGPMTDEQKAERRKLIANNKAWDAAEVVRRDWLTTLLTRKTLPKNAHEFTARTLAGARYQLCEAIPDGKRFAATALGLSDSYPGSPLIEHLDAHPTKANHVTLAIIIGALEKGTGRHSWRTPDPHTADYLNTLATWGYTLSPVERIAALLDDTAPGN